MLGVSFSDVTVFEGGPGIDAVIDIASMQKGRFLECYADARKTEPDVDGRVEVGFRLNPDGSVMGLTSTDGERHTEAAWSLVRCARGVLRTITFPRGKSGGGIRMVLAFHVQRR